MEELLKKELPVEKNPSMRDIFDFCKRHGIESLAQGMIELAPPASLRKIGAERMGSEEGHTYRARKGEEDYLSALCSVLAKNYDTNVTRDCLLGTSGVTGAIVASLLMCYAKGVRKFGITNPFYTYHSKHVTTTTKTQPVFVQLNHQDNTFDINWESLAKQLEEGMGCLIVVNPGNPSGRVFSKETLTKLVKMTSDKHCYLILDEIYCDLVWEGKKFYSPCQDGVSKYVISCRGFSKNVACQSWRVGYIISHPETVNDILIEHDPIYISVPISQHAIAQFLSVHPDQYFEHIKHSNLIMQRNLKLLGETLPKAMGWTFLEPDGSMYAMFRHNEESDMDAVISAIKKGVGLAPGTMFFEGSPKNTGFIRIHVGLSEERVKKICDQLLKK